MAVSGSYQEAFQKNQSFLVTLSENKTTVYLVMLKKKSSVRSYSKDLHIFLNNREKNTANILQSQHSLGFSQKEYRRYLNVF